MQSEVGFVCGAFGATAIIIGTYHLNNTHDISLSDREDNAIEHGVCDYKAAQSLEKKLTDEFGKSGFTFDVKPPESCESQAQTASGPQPK